MTQPNMSESEHDALVRAAFEIALERYAGAFEQLKDL